MVENIHFILAMILVSSAKAAPGNVVYQETTTEDFSIIGGEVADIKDVPYQVELILESKYPYCGGSIVAADIILTAAHCVFDGSEVFSPERLQVRAGTNQAMEGGTLVNVAKINMYPGYQFTNFSNDVAVLRLAEKLTYGDTIKPVQLAESGKPPAAGSEAIVSGWGRTSPVDPGSKTLLKVTISIIDTETCKQKMGAPVDDSMLCAGNPKKGSCMGDSGGPLVKDNVQYGVVSWGWNDCSDPSVYSNVANLRSWIDQAIKDVQ